MVVAALFGGNEANGQTKAPTPARGPLCVHPDNPRYFTDGTGKAVYLTGAHTWNNLVGLGLRDVGHAGQPRVVHELCE